MTMTDMLTLLMILEICLGAPSFGAAVRVSNMSETRENNADDAAVHN